MHLPKERENGGVFYGGLVVYMEETAIKMYVVCILQRAETAAE